jgi:hypothetical protein
MKFCKFCGKSKTENQFRVVKYRVSDGGPVRNTKCDDCRRSYQKKYNDKRLKITAKTDLAVIRKDTNYADNKTLTSELIVSLALGKLTIKAQNMLILMNKNLSRKFKYRNEDDRQDCISEGLYQVFKNWHNFDPDRSDNAFAYISEIIKRGQAQGFNRINRKDYLTGEYVRDIPLSHLFTNENGQTEINI